MGEAPAKSGKVEMEQFEEVEMEQFEEEPFLPLAMVMVMGLVIGLVKRKVVTCVLAVYCFSVAAISC